MSRKPHELMIEPVKKAPKQVSEALTQVPPLRARGRGDSWAVATHLSTLALSSKRGKRHRKHSSKDTVGKLIR